MSTFTMDAYRHMLAHAGFGYDPARETAGQGRVRCAMALARAEQMLRNSSAVIEWRDDDDPDISWMDDQDRAEYRRGETEMLACVLWVPNIGDDQPIVATSLWGIHVRKGDDSYKRVIEAELAHEVGRLVLDPLEELYERAYWAARDVVTV